MKHSRANQPSFLTRLQLMLSAGSRLQAWRWLFGAALLISGLTRIALIGATFAELDPRIGSLVMIVVVGFVRDFTAIAGLLIPLLLFLGLIPRSVWRHRMGRGAILFGIAGWVFLLLLIAVSEWLFWLEFGARFNFIAVDYLIYTHEVLANLWESYPVPRIMLALLAVCGVIVWSQRASIVAVPSRGSERGLVSVSVYLMLLCGSAGAWTIPSFPAQHLFSNRYANELAENGVVQFARAFQAGELDYNRFYPRLAEDEAYTRVRRILAIPPMNDDREPFSLFRRVQPAGKPLRRNIVLITVESLSADYLTRFGNRQGITPNLDRIAAAGLLFTHLYATGTRTVRGLEAVTLSLPPTPGESIVKRPHNGGLVSLGSILQSHGYDVRFVYGGNARFDNMRTFFEGNGYEVIDRRDIPVSRIHHENAWGVADEDVYTQALVEMDRSAAQGRLSFTHIMTTSNHRPYTYPDGRIDLRSGHSGRDGGVKYTDWALGDFLARAERKRWFDSTLFVIIADHCASSAGKTELPLRRYHIPLLIYAPTLIRPAEHHLLASQIDVAPTVLALLRLPYRAPFFGRNLLARSSVMPAAYVSTYQELGYLRDNLLVQLAPNAPPVVIPKNQSAIAARGVQRELIGDAVALYQSAAHAYRTGGLRDVGVGFGDGQDAEMPVPRREGLPAPATSGATVANLAVEPEIPEVRVR